MIYFYILAVYIKITKKMSNKKIGIYKITSPSNRIYVGSSIDIGKRFKDYTCLNCRSQRKLFLSFKKYGVNTHLFEIIEECGRDVLLERELHYGQIYDVLNNGLNCKLPKNGEVFISVSNETREKQSSAMKGRNVGKPNKFYVLRKLNEEQVNDIRKLLIENKLTQLEIANFFNVNRKVVNHINLGKTYKCFNPIVDTANSKSLNRKLSKEDILKIKQNHKEGMKQKDIAKLFNINQSHISRLIRDKYFKK